MHPIPRKIIIKTMAKEVRAAKTNDKEVEGHNILPLK
jgi:hypothetical protein